MTAAEPADADPGDAFVPLGNEIRTAVRRVLGEAAQDAISFSEPYSRVDPDTDSGQCNYHLGKLAGQFVRTTDEGSRIRPEGLALHRAIRGDVQSPAIDRRRRRRLRL